jgi:UPF0176 protein
MNWKVAALYKFTPLEDLPALQKEIKNKCIELDICGTLLLAPEGINGTVAGIEGKIEKIIELLDKRAGILKKGEKACEFKYSDSKDKPFMRMKVRLKKEIVTLRAPEADPLKKVGTYVTPEEWDKLTSDPDVTLIDTRNLYETKMGIFKGAIDPEIDNFTEFKDFVKNKMDPKTHKKVAMFCTGGIRCEKASAYMLAHGFEDVYHLKGGILKYLETIPADKSSWEGSCFVFDKRIGLDHELKESIHKTCFGCRAVLEPEDIKHKSYEAGVSCPYCADNLTEQRINALRMRQSQINKQKNDGSRA